MTKSAILNSFTKRPYFVSVTAALFTALAVFFAEVPVCWACSL